MTNEWPPNGEVRFWALGSATGKGSLLAVLDIFLFMFPYPSFLDALQEKE